MRPDQAIEKLLALPPPADWTEKSIGAEVGVNQSTIHRIRGGQEPRFDLGTALIALAERVAKEQPVAPAGADGVAKAA